MKLLLQYAALLIAASCVYQFSYWLVHPSWAATARVVRLRN